MITSTLTTIMGQIACYTGKAVEWAQVVKSNFQYAPPPDQSSFDTPPPVKPGPDGNYPLPIPGMTKMI
ncbi:MAG TPA: hypothetical protein PK777_11160 [Thermoguttaceae bacterium]|nr:hypothetical protein [Thermoguttaceae bacterium]